MTSLIEFRFSSLMSTLVFFIVFSLRLHTSLLLKRYGMFVAVLYINSNID